MSSSQPTNPHAYDDYETDESWTQHPPLGAESASHDDPNDYRDDPNNEPFATGDPDAPDDDDDGDGGDDDDYEIFIPGDDELDAAEQRVINAQLTPDNGEEAVYSDDVQQAFERFENENLHNWERSDSQDIMFKEMEECMRYMTDEYSSAEMPESLFERAENSGLNPDAAEFCPSYQAPSTTTNQEIVVTSWVPVIAKIREEE